MNTQYKPRIGKNVIETLTLGMYEDSRFIYREYIQNAADQIDIAVENGSLKNRRDGKIHIVINQKDRTIIIEDNATGIESNKVINVLGDIALSEKDRTRRKGFRGIGRLGGLGYCDKLTFETYYKGENVKSIMEWDAKQLKEIIADKKYNIDAAALISAITSNTFEQPDTKDPYFRVKLENVTKDELLDKDDIENYLSIVAPIPFQNHFIFKEKIYAELIKEHKEIEEYCVFINTDPLYKPYTTTIYDNTGQRKDDILDIETYFITHKNDKIAFGWYGIYESINKNIPPKNISRGLRLRKGNIQIGSETTLDKFFKEPRLNKNFIGEIYTFSNDLIPNARRDYFLDNEICKYFEGEINKKFAQLVQLAYDTSKIRSKIDVILKYKEKESQYYDRVEQKGFSDIEEKTKYEEEIKKLKSEAEKAKRELDKLEVKTQSNKKLQKIFNKSVGKNFDLYKIQDDKNEIDKKKIKFRTDKLSKLNKEQRKLISKIFSIINTHLPPEDAEFLIQKIEEEFK